MFRILRFFCCCFCEDHQWRAIVICIVTAGRESQKDFYGIMFESESLSEIGFRFTQVPRPLLKLTWCICEAHHTGKTWCLTWVMNDAPCTYDITSCTALTSTIHSLRVVRCGWSCPIEWPASISNGAVCYQRLLLEEDSVRLFIIVVS